MKKKTVLDLISKTEEIFGIKVKSADMLERSQLAN